MGHGDGAQDRAGVLDTNGGKWGMGTTELGRLAWRREEWVKILFFNIVKKQKAKTAREDEMSEITKDAPAPLLGHRLPFTLPPLAF